MSTITTVAGRLTITIAGSEAIDLGALHIPIEVSPVVNSTTGGLVLTAKPNMKEVRETIQAIFDRAGSDD